MEKLDKVIAGLTGCIACICSNCEYGGEICTERLMQDALEVLEKLREENRDLHKDIETLNELLREAREKLSWSENWSMPNDWGEYGPEFPREGM